MTLIKYQHVQHVDSDEAEGLLEGVCHVFPKLDGSNMCAYLEDGEVHTMSRNLEISNEEPFVRYVRDNPGIGEFLRAFPGLRLYGEWLVPHTIRSYEGNAWNHWFVFDVFAEDGTAVYDNVIDGERVVLDVDGRRYIPYEEYEPILRMFGIACIPPIAVIENPTPEDLGRMADNDATFLMSVGSGEGVVVKRYGYVNKYGRTEWAKVINKEYSRARAIRCNRPDGTLENEIVQRFVTPDLVSKEHAKIVELGAERATIPARLLSMVWHCLITEYMWDILRKFGNKRIDFKALKQECDIAVKEARPEVFGLRL